MVNRKRHVGRRSIKIGIFVVCVLAASTYMLSYLGGNYHRHKLTYHHTSKSIQLRKYQAVVDTQEIGHMIALRQTLYLAELFKVRMQAHGLLEQFHQEVTHWGNVHHYYDPYNGVMYASDYEYNQKEGFGGDVDNAVNNAHTIHDYQDAIKPIISNIVHLQAMKADYADKTPWDHPHSSDLRLIHYHHLSGQVIVVSFIEQACRIYRNGKLVRAFLITSGRFNDPSPAGVWRIFVRKSPTVFRSYAPVGSVNWYPVTPIHYAMEYHTGGYYLHDSWWRMYYGPGTNFPHYDPDGEQFAGSGSHGCINLSVGDAAWLYNNTDYGTEMITY